MIAIRIGHREIAAGKSVFVVAEVSANHHQQFDEAVAIVKAAKEAGADAVKLQTYTPDTITIDCRNEYFQIGKGTLWEGKNLYQLYGEAFTPWEWQPKLKALADELGMDLFSTPFDSSSVDFLEAMKVPAHKIASFELVDIPLIRYIARTGKPIIMSTGMATLTEIGEAVQAIRSEGNSQIALLKCTSAYPAPPEEMNLRTIPDLAAKFNLPVGLSDHTLGFTAAATAVGLGACIIEKHLTLSRAVPGPDSAFSLEPLEFKAMVATIREVERSLGAISYEVSEHEKASRIFRRSLFVVEDMKAGEVFSEKNVRSIRPGYGLAPKQITEIIGRKAARDLKRGTPLSEDMVA